MNTAIFRIGNIQNVISLVPFAIENTEIFFGPRSIIFGSDAIGAVMRLSFENLPLEERGKPEINDFDEQKRPFLPSWITVNLKGFYSISKNLLLNSGVEKHF